MIKFTLSERDVQAYAPENTPNISPPLQQPMWSHFWVDELQSPDGLVDTMATQLFVRFKITNMINVRFFIPITFQLNLIQITMQHNKERKMCTMHYHRRVQVYHTQIGKYHTARRKFRHTTPRGKVKMEPKFSANSGPMALI